MLFILTVTIMNLNGATAAVSVSREYNFPTHMSLSIKTDGRLRAKESFKVYFGNSISRQRIIQRISG